MVTYYEILEVSRTASKEVITKAYKVLVRKYHPDLEQDETKKEEAKEKMVKINEAYETLSDDIKREKYDNNIALLEEKERREKEIQRIQIVLMRKQVIVLIGIMEEIMLIIK